MKKSTFLILILLGFVFIQSACKTTSEELTPGTSIDSSKSEACFFNSYNKVASLQLSGETDLYEIPPQQHICLERSLGTYTYELKVGRRTSKSRRVDFKQYHTTEVTLAFIR